MMKRLLLIAVVMLLAILFLTSFCDALIVNAAKKHIGNSHKSKVALVLGTSKYLKNGRPNLYFKYRIEKAFELYKKGRVEFFVVSGDNGSENYDEPTDMKNALIELGVPEGRIYCDFAGFSTLDSVLRMKIIFGQYSYLIVSQKFHLERAVYLAKRKGMQVVGVQAKSPPKGYNSTIELREQFARVKAVIEVLIDKGPFYEGKQIEIK